MIHFIEITAERVVMIAGTPVPDATAVAVIWGLDLSANRIYLWSSGDAALARAVAELLGIGDCCSGYLAQAGLEQCPCCDHLTLDDRGGYDICPICGWEDDGDSPEDGYYGQTRSGGPNGIPLQEGRAAYRVWAATHGLPDCARDYLRRPRDE